MKDKIVAIYFLIMVLSVTIGTSTKIGWRFLQKIGIVNDVVDSKFELNVNRTNDDYKFVPSGRRGFSNPFNRFELYVGKADKLLADSTHYIETTLASNLAFKYELIELFGLSQKLIGRTYIVDVDESNNTIKMSDGMLITDSFKYSEEDTLDKRVKKCEDIDEYLKLEGVDFVLVLTLTKEEPNDERIPQYVHLYSNENADRFVDKLNNTNIDYIDLREYAKTDEINLCDAFFKTDHHWKPEVGYWAYTKIAEHLRDNYNHVINSESLDINNFNKDVLEDAWLGSIGRRVGELYAPADDFTLISPQKDIDLCVYVDDEKQKVMKGGWFDTVLDGEKIQRIKSGNYNKYETDVYCIYDYANYLNLEIQNINGGNGKNIYVGRDSFGQVVLPYFALSYDKVYVGAMLDIDRLEKIIKEKDIDAVIYIQNSGNL